jgi:hypothetical protein
LGLGTTCQSPAREFWMARNVMPKKIRVCFFMIEPLNDCNLSSKSE